MSDPEDLDDKGAKADAPKSISVERDAKGRVAKGSRALNPFGRPTTAVKSLADYGRLITTNGQQALWGLWQLAENTKIQPSVRVAAYREVLDRTVGKSVDVQVLLAINGDGAQKDTLASVGTGALEALLAKLQAAAPAASGDVVDAEVVSADSQSAPKEPKGE